MKCAPGAWRQHLHTPNTAHATLALPRLMQRGVSPLSLRLKTHKEVPYKL